MKVEKSYIPMTILKLVFDLVRGLVAIGETLSISGIIFN